MSETKVPAVFISPVFSDTGNEANVADHVVVEVPLSNKFGFAWPNDPFHHVHGVERPPQLSGSEGETDSSEAEIPFLTGRPPSHNGHDGESDILESSNVPGPS